MIFLLKIISNSTSMYFQWTSLNIYSGKDDLIDLHLKPAEDKENVIYIRGEFRESLGMNFFSPFQPEREFKVYKSCKCSQIICSRVH